MSTEAAKLPIRTRTVAAARHGDDAQPARSYPISRWYLRPAASRLAAALAPTRVRPVHLTFCGSLAAVGATAVLVWRPEAMPLAALLVLLYWFFDRADGQLARQQGTVSTWGAWLDGNIDELADVALHVAAAVVVAGQVAASWPWWLLIAFLGGKYLLMYGLALEEHEKRGHSTFLHGVGRDGESTAGEKVECPPFRRAYHLPGNADVRVHLFVLALATGYLAVELALVAVYYNLRWLARYALVARRLGGVR